MIDQTQAEYQALRDTIRERGTARMCSILGGVVAWAALTIALLIAELDDAVAFVPLLVLASTFEINFFIHTGVERIGRYIQVFHEERAGATGWETTAMSYGVKFPSGLDPLFSMIFAGTAALDFLTSLAVLQRRPGWIALSLVCHLAFGYRIVSARVLAASQRSLDLDRFRSLLSK